MKRVVITGLGVISSIGNNKEEVLASLKEGKSVLNSFLNLLKSVCAAKLPAQLS
ncbi:3-oxoacyl-ACP synthase [Actinobacillus pleuropneumoniae]|nr:3-oxoacyl-ACP synthase [Actinobacillus pleuropneumoniae]